MPFNWNERESRYSLLFLIHVWTNRRRQLAALTARLTARHSM